MPPAVNEKGRRMALPAGRPYHRHCHGGEAMGTDREKLVGAWRLVSFESRRPDGTVVRPWGDDPMGICIWLENGYVAAQLMRPDRPRFASSDPFTGTPEEMQRAFGGCIAYFGEWEVDEANRRVIHHIHGSMHPNMIGGDQVRGYEFRGERLVLIPPPREVDGGTVTSELAWERVAETGA
ncbi:MAG: lipocalin-like domain-containing protein [Dehalococcoidia bacterium]|nr:lipocalin-like domain-containing protein [Chloroflexi bacterium CFX7]MCK6564126.1 lipocalin-like domain-containing protein [Dehalococcoidia bacterium]NUQ55151.1 lipocalin-like domain-containing protein [Dehalococcoidia bacterium]RIL01650.1 MAG: hypothetical protein DCC78_10365 [bacterium]